MKLFGVLGLLCGVALATLLVLSHGAGAVWHSIAALGWGGLAIILVFHLCLIGAMGFAWFLLGRGRADSTWLRYAWGRLIRDSTSEALPLSQIGGFVLGARAAALTGVSGAFAAASTVVDVTVELAAQLSYVAVGLAILQVLRPDSKFVLPIAAGVAGMAILVCIFVVVQARGAGLVERIGRRMANAFLGAQTAALSNVQVEIRQLHGKRARLATSTLVHFTTWVLAGVETWVTLRIMGVHLSLPATVVIDSLLYALRSIAFMVPNALGVQEGGLMFLGAMFGLSPDIALALSLIKRGRDLIIGLPALLVWQIMEGHHAWDQMITDATPETVPIAHDTMERSQNQLDPQNRLPQ